MIPSRRESTTYTESLAPAARIATANGTGVDLSDTETQTVVFHFGAWTDGTHTPSVTESIDNSTFTAVAASDLDGTLTAISAAPTATNRIQKVGYIGSRRYIRANITVATATTGAISSAQVVKHDLRKAPK